MSTSEERAAFECARIRERISAGFDGEESVDGGLRAHLASCPSCSRFAESLPALSARLAELHSRAPKDLWGGIETRIAERTAPPPRRRAPWTLRLAAGLVGFAGFGAAGLIAQGPSPEPAATAPEHVRPFQLLGALSRSSPLSSTSGGRLVRHLSSAENER